MKKREKEIDLLSQRSPEILDHSRNERTTERANPFSAEYREKSDSYLLGQKTGCALYRSAT